MDCVLSGLSIAGGQGLAVHGAHRAVRKDYLVRWPSRIRARRHSISSILGMQGWLGIDTPVGTLHPADGEPPNNPEFAHSIMANTITEGDQRSTAARPPAATSSLHRGVLAGENLVTT
jgi:hypothetical protein